MERILEPELMEDEDQVAAYAQADFSEPHNHFIDLLAEKIPRQSVDGIVLDLGCGPGDISFRFAKAHPNCRLHGVDGSIRMIDYANKELQATPDVQGRIEFFVGLFPEVQLPRPHYSVLISNSLLHHLPDPQILWTSIKRWAAPGSNLFVMDLMRPDSPAKAREFVEQYAADEPDVLQRDFYNSLLAAFTMQEVKDQLQIAGLQNLSAEAVSDRHMIVWGEMRHRL